MVTLASRLSCKAQRHSTRNFARLAEAAERQKERGRERKMERAVRLPAELLFPPPHSPTIPHPQYAAGRGWKSCLAAETRSPSFDESYVPTLASILPRHPLYRTLLDVQRATKDRSSLVAP